MYLKENHISEIGWVIYRWYIVNFEARGTAIEPQSELSPHESKLAQDPIVNFVIR